MWRHWMPAALMHRDTGPYGASEPGPRSYQDGEARALAASLRQSPASLSATWLNSRRELSNEYLLAKIGVDTAENELIEVLFNIIQYCSFVS